MLSYKIPVRQHFYINKKGAALYQTAPDFISDHNPITESASGINTIMNCETSTTAMRAMG